MDAKNTGRAGRQGFTLLELVAVIGIIAIMGMIVMSGFNTIARALSQKSGADDLRRSLNLARQVACVDGKPTVLWLTGVDRYVVAREAGTVSRKKTSGTQSFDWAGGTIDDLRPDGNQNVWWIFDDYADLKDSSIDYKFDDTWDADSVKATILGYKDIAVFDMDANVLAKVVVPPMFDKATESWFFGVSGKDIPSGAFAPGHDYGWLLYPEQSLPKGFAFKNTWDESGGFDEGKRLFVRFRPDGSAEQTATFVVHEFATEKDITVSVTDEGRVR